MDVKTYTYLTPEQLLVRLRAIRKARKLSQEQVGVACKLTGNTISRIEMGLRPLEYAELQAICRALDVQLVDVVQAWPMFLPEWIDDGT